MEHIKKKFNKNDLKYKLKTFTNKTWKKALLIISSLILLNTIVFLATGKNLIERSIKALLYQAGIYTEEVKLVNINSPGWYTYEEGSWYIDKSAEWIGENKAQVTIDLSTRIKTNEKDKDVILVLDISGSMYGEKINKVKSDAIELTEYLLSNSNNKIALITFDSSAEILSDFTTDKEYLINTLENLETRGATNYNEALKNVSTILSSYNYSNDRETVVLFLTDGFPNVSVPNQIAEYKYLKERYPFILIEGIQYEMGENIIKEIIEISDKQFLANTINLNNVLFEASLLPEAYESFEITDYIENDYFYIENSDDIKVSIGNTSLETENGHQKVVWNLENNSYRTGSTAKMTIDITLKEEYQYNKGLYPTNTKEIIKSKLQNNEEEVLNSNKTPVLKNGYKITYDTNEPQGCRLKSTSDEIHYAFETITKKTDELSCPGYTFKGWEVEEEVTIINDDTFIMPPNDITIRGIWTSQNISKSMDGTVHEKATLWKKVKSDAEKNLYGAHIFSSTINDPFAIYYYNQSSNNNVYFANSCWKIIRTTETGGVKILYNGIPSNGTSCENPDISNIPKSTFNESNYSMADVGYMYNERYLPIKEDVSHSFYKVTYNITGANYSYISDSYRKENGRYYLENKDGSAVESKTWSTDYESFVGHFTCHYPDTTSCTELAYVTDADKYFGYNMLINNNADFDDINKDLKIGKSYVKNSNGSYTLTNVDNLKLSDWAINYNKYNNQYICGDYTTTTCTDLKVISPEATKLGILYEDIDNDTEAGILYGNSFTYDGSNYHLVDTITTNAWVNIYNKLDNNHYTCLNKTGTCENLYYLTDTKVGYKTYYELKNGKGINEIIDEMLHNEDTNKVNSVAKDTLEQWYEDNLINFTNSIEDTIYCNNRNLSSLGNLNPNGGTASTYTQIYFTDGQSPSLTCPNINDRFTVSKENGNGKSKYPIGLLTRKEAQLAGTGVLGTTTIHWLMSPYSYNTDFKNASISYGRGGNVYSNSADAVQFIVPLISIKNDIGYIKGDGTPSNPYIIE